MISCFNPNFIQDLTNTLESGPKEITLDSPYLIFPPIDENKECQASFHPITLLFKQVEGQDYNWDVQISKIQKDSTSLKKQAHFVLVPELLKEEMFSQSAKENGCYSIKLKGWTIHKGEQNFPKDLSEQALKILRLFPRITF